MLSSMFVLSVVMNAITKLLSIIMILYYQLPMPLLNYSQSVLCEPQSLGNVTGSAVAVARGNCTYATKAVVVQDGGAKALLILTDMLVSISLAHIPV